MTRSRARTGRVAAVVLAAGGSRRFGDASKQLVDVGGVSAVRRAAEVALASACDEVVVVTGDRAAAVAAEVRDLPLRLAHNRGWESGQASSVRRGVEALSDDVAAAVFVPCDQPRLDAATVDLVVAAWRRGADVVVPSHGGRRGAPVLFGRRRFADLATLEGDEGGRQLLARRPDEVVAVELEDDTPLRDFDTPEELAALLDGSRTPEAGSGE
ncbi:MAG: nucleotidyltransferase family protein [Thermoanaerobaculia bacterium]|nr:nucleotidyltransferase family protein [Thermoanaerobaculia bacterium]